MSTNGDYAEKNSDIILHIFEKQWGCFGADEITEEKQKKIGSANDCGLYLFFLKSKATNKRYPVYIGYTGRNFAQRFYEHATRESGAIYKILTSKVFGDFYDLFVYTHSATPVAAKVLESIFLNAFNFSLNTEENGNTHELDISYDFTVEDSYDQFKYSYQYIMKELTNDIPQSFHGMSLEWSK